MTEQKRRGLSLVLTLLLCLSMLPLPVFSASKLYFTSLNDNLLPLSSGTMPLWSGGSLYVPYAVFDTDSTGVDLGLSCTYNRNSGTVSLLTQNLSNLKILVFDLNSGTCRDDINQIPLKGRAIIRNGRPFLPVDVVCSFFGLTYSYNAIASVDQGYLVRIKSSSVILTDAQFMDAGRHLIETRLREYNQSITPPAPKPPVSPTLPDPPEVSSADVTTYLSFTCRSSEGLSSILDTLSHSGAHALFFLTPDLLRTQGDLVRRMIGSGHTVGLLADGADWDESRAILDEGQWLLSQVAFARTTAAHLPKEQRSQAQEAHWVCWSGTLDLSPSQNTSSGAFAASALRKLKGRTRTTYLSMPVDQNTARVLPTLLRQLREGHFELSIPLETRL